MDNIHLVKKTTLSVEKKPLALFLPFLGSISLETSTKLNKQLKKIPRCCKMQIVFKNKTTLGNNVHFKDRIPKNLTFGVVYKFQCENSSESPNGEWVRKLNVRTGEHIGTTYFGEPLIKKQVTPKNSFTANHLLF